MNKVIYIKSLLQESVNVSQTRVITFFKTGIGDYAEHDRFIGITVPILRKIAKEYQDLALEEVQTLIESRFNEERALALFILVRQYQKQINNQEKLYQFYLSNLQYVNNWNLVDASAHLIMGAHLYTRNMDVLVELARSDDLWKRRVAIVATWYFIRNKDLEYTFKIAQTLLQDQHDLIHKAVGWMLREAGKRDQEMLVSFLNEHARYMPRTMLRYAIEKFPADQRMDYLK